MKLKKRLEIASHCVDGAWLLFDDMTDEELAELTPEMREFKMLVDRARDVSYDILDELNRESCREYLRLKLVE